jgi:hypothetical protein
MFCREHQFTIAAAGAIGTLLAVLTSIFLAWLGVRANRTKLVATAHIMRVVGGGIGKDERVRYLTVSITNTGVLPLRIEFGFFGWRIPFDRIVYQVVPLDHTGDQIYPKISYPVEIAPRSSHRACLSDYQTFVSEMQRHRPKLNWWRHALYPYQRAYVWTSDGRRFRARINRDLKKELRRMTTAPITTENLEQE